MKNRILIIILALGVSQFTMAQQKSYGSTRSNKQTISVKETDTMALKTKANHNTTRSNQAGGIVLNNEETDTIGLKSKSREHMSTLSTKGSVPLKDSDTVTNTNESTKANINTSRSNIKQN